MTDGTTTTRLRAALAAAALLGLGGALAPGYAEDAAPALSQPVTAAADPALPRFQPAAEPAGLLEDTFDAVLPEDGLASDEAWDQVGGGMASWYGAEFKGRRTASGETFDPAGYTAAHRTLPFGSKVRVTSATGRSVVVRINDRGPFARGRVIDVSQAAARDLGLIGPGHGRVTLAVLEE
jgi:rare lipoprotein A